MKVLYFPPWGDGDYQRFLYDSLSKIGVDSVEAKNTKSFPIFAFRKQLNDADIFHIHWIHTLYKGGSLFMPLFSLLFLLQIAYLRRSDTPIVWTVHNLSTHDTLYPRLDRFLRMIAAKIICDKIIIHCKFAEGEVINKYNLSDNKTTVIPHGNFYRYPNKRKPLDIPDQYYCYLHFGSIKPYKGTLELIKEFNSVADESDRLLIMGGIGNESYVEKIKNAASSDKKVMTKFGYIPNEDFNSIANDVDAVVLPYTDILTSGVAHLALSFQLPVVAPRTGCLPETIPKEAGVLYESGGLADALNDVKNLEPIQVANAADAAMEKKDWEKIAKSTNSLYKDLKN